jgi:hypothetical protein
MTFKQLAQLPEITAHCVNGEVSEAELLKLFTLAGAALSFNTENKRFTAQELAEIGFEDVLNFIAAYSDFISEIQNARALPRIAADEESEPGFESLLWWDKLAADYANLSITEVQRLNYVDFLILRREAFIHALSQTEKGAELLSDAYCLEQTEPDRAALRKRFGGGNNGVE